MSDEIQMRSRSLASTRRSFLKASLTVTALSAAPSSVASSKRRVSLPPVPAVSDLAGGRFVHRTRDLYSNLTTQNELGYAQAAKSVSGLTAISVPPFGCCGVPDTPWSPGFLLTCELFLNGRILISYPSSGDQVAFQWYPHRFVRETEAEGLRFTTETFMPAKRRAVAPSIRVKDLGSTARAVTLGFDMRAGVAKKTDAWFTNSPGEADNRIERSAEHGCLIFEARHSQAVTVQGLTPKANRVDSGRMLNLEMKLGSGETKQVHYVNAVDQDRQAAMATYDAVQANFSQVTEVHKHAFNGLIRSAFTPWNSDFSGYRSVVARRTICALPGVSRGSTSTSATKPCLTTSYFTRPTGNSWTRHRTAWAITANWKACQKSRSSHCLTA